MFSREEFLVAIQSEIAICKHLFDKLPEGALDFSLGEKMRTTSQLLDYLSYCGIVPAVCCAKDDWSEIQGLIKEYSNEDVSNFGARMDAQATQLSELVSGLSDEDLRRTVKLPWGDDNSLGQALVGTSLSFLTAYRMQLFLHAKAAGATQLNTMNCWKGVDPS